MASNEPESKYTGYQVYCDVLISVVLVISNLVMKEVWLSAEGNDRLNYNSRNFGRLSWSETLFNKIVRASLSPYLFLAKNWQVYFASAWKRITAQAAVHKQKCISSVLMNRLHFTEPPVGRGVIRRDEGDHNGSSMQVTPPAVTWDPEPCTLASA